jgi:predicted ester cyclase
MTSSDDNKSIVRKGIEGIWNKKDLSVIDQVTHASYVCHMPGDKKISGIDGFKTAFSRFQKAFPDAKMKIENQVAEGDEVITSMIVEGTQTGRFESDEGVIEATGKKIHARQVSRMKIRDGKVVEEWVTWDESVAVSQLDPGVKRLTA